MIILLKSSKSLVKLTGKTTDHIGFKPFPDTILLLNMDRVEGILNRITIDGMVNNHSSSYNS